jgi:APA family basic amino acid/polyamine antiporter
LIALFALIFLGYIKKTDILANNFTNMWDASKTVLSPDGTVTVTKLCWNCIVRAAAATMVNPYFKRCLEQCFIAGEIKEPKEYS